MNSEEIFDPESYVIHKLDKVPFPIYVEAKLQDLWNSLVIYVDGKYSYKQLMIMKD
ncbi:hypothetical protein NEF87_001965 [Candidatus Lokiarchaeum ossiferum]|uniref:Uncharacterized protein n=1 Tax=Candidatus Lokiarchaeum ossiferum TaxID=2951803 RepID=A0ABY6HQI6_9ARCH|nr:hypothetical protein NEF87_001965 [Candidatus Lokiarchaeum sp. B-35]